MQHRCRQLYLSLPPVKAMGGCNAFVDDGNDDGKWNGVLRVRRTAFEPNEQNNRLQSVCEEFPCLQ